MEIGKIVTACLIVAGALPCLAQTHKKDTTLNRTVVVEQEYNPDIMDAQKVNVLPAVKEVRSTGNSVEYDRNANATSALPGTALGAYTASDRQDGTKQGYLRAGYGNKGNLDMEGNYSMGLSQIDRLNLSASLMGMNGKVRNALTGERWDSRFYRTNAAVDFTHNFKTMDLNVAGSFGLHNFNNMPGLFSTKRRSTFGDAHVGILSTDRDLPLQFNLQTGVLLFTRAHNPFSGSDAKTKETIIRTKGDVTGELINDGKVGVAFEMNNMIYDAIPFEDYTTLDLNPYYEWSGEGLSLHLGAHVDLATKVGKRLYVAPDVKGEYVIVGRYVLYAQATGGRLPNDLRRLEALNPYGLLFDQPKPAYEQLNALAGFKMNPVDGLWIDVFGGYKQMKEEAYDYADYMFDDFVDYGQGKISHSHFGARIDYDYNDLFGFMLKGQLFNWDTPENPDGDLAKLYKPKARLDAQVSVRPISPLKVTLDYEFVRRSNAYATDFRSRFADKHINNLSIGATYRLTDSFSAYARLANLLDRKYENFARSPMPGFNFVGGLVFDF